MLTRSTSAPRNEERRPSGSWTTRLFSRNAAVLLARNSAVSCLVFAVNLGLLWMLVERFSTHKLAAAAIAFIAANSLHYAFGPAWIFRGTRRGLLPGYLYFLVNAAVGLIVTLALYAAMLGLTSINYIVARVLVSVVAGLVVFLLNAILNFRRI